MGIDCRPPRTTHRRSAPQPPRFKHERSVSYSFDYLIVGAGFAGSVLAERLAAGSAKSVLLCDRRDHIGGNAYDHPDAAGILVHKYGPHIFHTNSRDIFEYLSRFTAWRAYEHRVLACVEGKLLPIPINLDTINRLYGLKLTEGEVEQFLAVVRFHVRLRAHPNKSSSAGSDAICTRNFSGITRANSGASIRRSSMLRSLPASRCEQIGTTDILPTASSSCPSKDSRAFSKTSSTTRISRWRWAPTIGSSGKTRASKS